MINVLNLFLSLFLPLPSVKLLNTWFQMDNRYVLVSIKYFIQLHIFHDNNNANTVWYMILYTDTMCMIPEWLYVNLISLLGNSVMPLALFTGNKKKRKLCSSYYALISKLTTYLIVGSCFLSPLFQVPHYLVMLLRTPPLTFSLPILFFSAPSCN